MWRLDPEKSALLVIDMQNDFVLEGFPMEVAAARTKLPQMQGVIAASRAVGIPVIYTQHILLDSFNISPLETACNPRLLSEGMRKGSHGAQIIDDLTPEADDVVITKHRYDAFHNTPLDSVLKTIRGLHQIDTVIIIGTLTEACCESTARSAYMRDYKVALVSDATGALSPAAQEATENNITSFFGQVLSSGELIAGITPFGISAAPLEETRA